jgi:hypothetical protein
LQVLISVVSVGYSDSSKSSVRADIALKTLRQEHAKSIMSEDKQSKLLTRMQEAACRHVRRFPIHEGSGLDYNISLRFPHAESRRLTTTPSFKQFFESDLCDQLIRAAIAHFAALLTVEHHASQRIAAKDIPPAPDTGRIHQVHDK